MLTFLKKNYRSLLTVNIALVSFIGLIIFKGAIEKERVLSQTSNDYVQLNNYKFYFAVLQVLCILVVSYIVLSWFFRKFIEFRQLKNERTEAELAMLKSKIDPHFFFNTLNNLYSLAIKKSDDTPKMIHKLSEIMRYTIYEGENESVKLEQEITYLEQYIEIHKIRYKKDVDICFNKKVEQLNLNVAPLLFIMLLENAFKHGVESLTNNAFVKIDLNATDDIITFNVENNFDPKRNVKKGMGLENLKRRLSLIYPNKHKLNFSSKDDIYSVELTLIIK